MTRDSMGCIFLSDLIVALLSGGSLKVTEISAAFPYWCGKHKMFAPLSLRLFHFPIVFSIASLKLYPPNALNSPVIFDRDYNYVFRATVARSSI